MTPTPPGSRPASRLRSLVARNPFVTGAGVLVLGNVAFAVCQLLKHVVIVRTAGLETLGAFAFAYAVVMPIFMLCEMHAKMSHTTDVDRKYAFGEFRVVRILSVSVAGLLAALYAISGLMPSEFVPVVLALAVARGVDSYRELGFGEMQRCRLYPAVAVSMLLRGGLHLIGFTIVLMRTDSLPQAILTGAAVSALVHLLVDRPRVRSLIDRSRPVRKEAIRPIVFASVPNGVMQYLIGVIAGMPRLALGYLSGPAAVGLYAIVAQFIWVGRLLIQALNQVTVTELALLWSQNERPKFQALVWKMVGVGAAVGVAGVIIGWVLGGWLLTLLYGAEYAYLSGALGFTMLATGLHYTNRPFVLAAIARKATWPCVGIYAGLLAVSVGLSVGLVVAYDFHGSLAAFILTSFVELLAFSAWHAWQMRTAPPSGSESQSGLELPAARAA